MAGQRQTGSWGLEGVTSNIDEGTMCRAQTPGPGSVGTDHGPDADAATSSSLLDRAITGLLGSYSFGAGVIYGLGENVVGSVAQLGQLARIFLLADLYDRAHQPLLSMVSPFGVGQTWLAQLSMRAFRAELEAAHAERQALIAELGYALTHPGEVFDNVTAEYAAKWERFNAYLRANSLRSQFEAGRIFGELLLDVLTLIGGGAAAVKAASRIPKLAKLARVKGRPSGGGVAGAPRPAPATPSQARSAQRAPDEPPRKDAYVVDRRGVPIGAREGVARPGLPATTLKQDGWPDLPGSQARNFNAAEPVTLKPGTKIYRIVDEGSNPAGSYWSETIPPSRAAWRSDFAVKTDWNTNGRFVEYTVPDGPGLNVWRGETAAQQLSGSNYYLPGGGQQIWMPPNTVTPTAPKPTGW